MPAPTTQTSADVSDDKGEKPGSWAVAAQTDVCCEGMTLEQAKSKPGRRHQGYGAPSTLTLLWGFCPLACRLRLTLSFRLDTRLVPLRRPRNTAHRQQKSNSCRR